MIRRAVPADLPAILAIYNHAVEQSTATFDLQPFSLEARAGWIESFDDDNPMIVAEAEGLLGFAYYGPFRKKPAYDSTRELTVYVAPEAQGRGLGRGLYGWLIEHARANPRVHTLLGVVAGDNPGSVALHEAFGFEQVGHLREVGRKFGQWIDTHYWQLQVDQGGG